MVKYLHDPVQNLLAPEGYVLASQERFYGAKDITGLTMRVAIDTSPLESGDRVRGVGEYTSQLLHYLKLIANKRDDLSVEEVKIAQSDLSNLEVVHVPYFNPFRLTVPENSLAKVVVTIHDLIPLVYPNNYPSGLNGRLNLQKQKKRLKGVGAVVTDSETSKKDIVRFLGIDAKKIVPVYLAPAKDFKELSGKDPALKKVTKKYKLPDKFVLYVGDINYNKNIPGLINACRLAETNLVIVGKQALEIESVGADIRNLNGPRDIVRFLLGKPHPELAHYKQLLSELKDNKNVIRTGYVAKDELVAIYNLATIYCQPSFYEGFGLPVLEAMSCGIPVVAARTQALVEIAGDSALSADPKDPRDIAKKLRNLLKSKRMQRIYSRKGLTAAKKYSWKKTAEETLKVYEKVFGGRDL